MRMQATIKVEYEAESGQAEYVLESALRRGRAQLAVGIEYGMLGAGRTHIRHGSVKVDVVEQKIVN